MPILSKKCLRILVSFFAFTQSPFVAANADLFHYWTRIPEKNVDCQKDAAELAGNFFRATSIRPLEVKCLSTAEIREEGKVFRVHSVDLTYRAREKLSPYLAILGLSSESMEPTGISGVYSTYRACLEDLRTQVEIFESQTRQLAVSAFCEKSAVPYFGSHVAKITGFGTPYFRLFSSTFKYQGAPSQEFRNRVLALFSNLGAKVARVWGNEVLYYSSEKLPILHFFFSNFSSTDQCQSQTEDLKELLSKAGASEVLLDCFSLRKEVLTVRRSLEAVVVGNVWLGRDFGNTGPTYESFEECLSDRPRVLQLARDTRPWSPLGGNLSCRESVRC
jgi:hypothetical protein